MALIIFEFTGTPGRLRSLRVRRSNAAGVETLDHGIAPLDTAGRYTWGGSADSGDTFEVFDVDEPDRVLPILAAGGVE